jgi:hypothetical protein
MLLRNVGCVSTDYTVLYLRREYSSSFVKTDNIKQKNVGYCAVTMASLIIEVTKNTVVANAINGCGYRISGLALLSLQSHKFVNQPRCYCQL